MKRVILVLAWAAVAVATYLTGTPITEPPGTDDVDNMAALGSDCEPEGTSKGQQPPDRGQCSSAVYMRPGDRDFLEQTGTLPVRSGRGNRVNDNFIRFGRAGRNDNYIRLGRDRSDNFVRFGRGRQDNFIRLGRTKQGNFLRFGREMKDSSGSDETDVSPKHDLRVGRGGKSDSNFIRLGRARPNSGFIRLGRGDDEIAGPEEMRRSNGNFVRFGRQAFGDSLAREGRSSGNSDLRRGKLTDRNFIRLGRSGQQYSDDTEGESDDNYEESLGRSNKRGKTPNFVRFGRDVAHIGDAATLPSGDSAPSDKHIRSKRSVIPTAEDETPADSSDYPIIVSKNAYDDKISSALDDSQITFRYYSPLASGIPNYILSPELSALAPLTIGAESKRTNGDGHNRNYIRLG
jgi:hypothetical protein